MSIEAKVICDSVGQHSPRLTTFALKFHQFILAELNTHRTFSRSDRSTRAVTFKRLCVEVEEDPAMPVVFLSARKGMGGGEPLNDFAQEMARARWKADSTIALNCASRANLSQEARESVNARLLPYIYTYSIRTCCEPGLLNFFGLRLDKAARPEIRALAEKTWAAWNESEPQKLRPGEWHLPLIEGQDVDTMFMHPQGHISPDEFTIWAQRVSAARCARQSFTYSKKHSISEDLALYDRLVNASPMHLGPLEHQATPDTRLSSHVSAPCWLAPELHGNLPGWVQFRKTIPRENCAPLPEGYTR